MPLKHPILKDSESYVEPNYRGELPNFGFTFIFKRAAKHVIKVRFVFTIMMYLASIGGTVKVFETMFKPLLAYVLPQPLSRDVLNNNFKYDEVVTNSSIVEQIKDENVALNSPVMETLSSASGSLQSYLITYWNTIMLAHFSCCAKRDQQLLRIKSGKKTLNKHLNIVNLIKMSMEVSVLKKLIMSPR